MQQKRVQLTQLVLQALMDYGVSTIPSICDAMAHSYPRERSKMQINIYSTLRRLKAKGEVAIVKVDTGTAAYEAYRITAKGQRRLPAPDAEPSGRS